MMEMVTTIFKVKIILKRDSNDSLTTRLSRDFLALVHVLQYHTKERELSLLRKQNISRIFKVYFQK